MTNDLKDEANEQYKKTKAGLDATKNKIEDPDRDMETEYKKEKFKEDVKEKLD